jgi:2-methylisocitrate lyase-like PEP mutase family enzyme
LSSQGADGRLDAILQPGAGIVLPGAFNALAARVIESVGFPVVYVTGAGVANGYLGAPDVGLVSAKEAVDHLWAICDAVDVPVMADADTGYGNALNVYRTVRDFERAGATSIQLEDQVFPKRCGHFEGKAVIPASEMVQKVRAAVDARRNSTTLILARTDCRATDGMQAAIDRANMYREAGADLLFIEAPVSEEELAEITAKVPGRHICNMVVGGKTPLLPQEKLAAMGYVGIVYANTALQSALLAMQNVLASLHETGSVEQVRDQIIHFLDRQRFVRHEKYQEMEKRFAS